jgi:hypothetical protein
MTKAHTEGTHSTPYRKKQKLRQTQKDKGAQIKN